MLLFLLPFAVVFGVVAMSERNARRDRALAASPRLALPAASSPAPTPYASANPPMIPLPSAMVSGAPPAPFDVLVAMLHRNQTPPPFIVQCAIADVRMRGKPDVATYLEEEFAHVLKHATAPAGTPGAAPAPAAPETPTTTATTTAEAAPAADASAHPIQIKSPINGIDDDAWSRFATACARESASFAGPKHVGRYRHNRDRLIAIGIDPDSIVGSTDAQDDAFATDAFENLRELVESGTLEQYVGTPLSVPTMTEKGPIGASANVDLTVSGILGVAMAAGLEGCVGWLENENDRRRYPNTTAAFLRCNGAF